LSYKVWIKAFRLFSLTTIIIPILLSCAYVYKQPTVTWNILPIIILVAFAALLASVMFNDYYDFLYKIDTPESFGSSRVLVDGLLKPNKLFVAAWLAFLISAAGGIYLIYLRGVIMFFLILSGLLAAYFYTGKLGYKYYALGELMVFIVFGPLLVETVSLALTGKLSLALLLVSLPISFLVTAILNGNNIRDIKHDRQASIKTLPILIGKTLATKCYIILILSAYLSVLALIIGKLLPWWALATFITMPMALTLCKDIYKQSKLKVIDASTAKLHLAFGLILVAAVFLLPST